MALTKVKGSGVEGITNLSNATFLSVDASEVATLLTSAVINSEGGAVTTNIAQGLGKAWCNLNGGSSFALRDSFNLTSATDNGTGDYTLTIANDMGNTNYATPMSGGNTSGASRYGAMSDSDGKATGTAGFFGFQTNTGGALDQEEVSVVFLGDLA